MAVLPTGNDLRKLPLRALVAYTARCARRVQSSYCVNPDHPDAEQCIAAIETAIAVSMSFAAGEEINTQDAAEAEEAAVRTVVVASQDESAARETAFAANAAYAAINVTNTAMGAQFAASRPTEAGKAVLGAVAAADAALSVNPHIKHAVTRDWQKLSKMPLGAFPSLGKPVDASDEGPLGPIVDANKSKRSDNSTVQATASPAAKAPASKHPSRPSYKSVERPQESSERDVIRKKRRQLQKEREELQREREELLAERIAFEKEREEWENEVRHLRTEVTDSEDRLKQEQQLLAESGSLMRSDLDELRKQLQEFEIEHHSEPSLQSEADLETDPTEFGAGINPHPSGQESLPA